MISYFSNQIIKPHSVTTRTSHHGMFNFMSFIWTCLLFSSTPAVLANYTDEDEARDEYYSEWTPSAVSLNRRWLTYWVSGKIVVVDTSNIEMMREYSIPFAITGIAISDSGQRVAVVAAQGCTGMIELPGEAQKTAVVYWLEGTAERKPCTTPNVLSSPYNDRFIPPPQPVAISVDGTLVAGISQDSGILQVVDIDKRAIVKLFPRGAEAITNIEFVESNNALLVSSFQGNHALWDLTSGELINFVSDQHAIHFYTRMDRVRGTVLVQHEDGKVLEIDLRQCKDTIMPFASHGGNHLTISADGTWYATAEEKKITVHSTASGEELSSFMAPYNVAFLTEGIKPNTLVSVTRSPREPDGKLKQGYPQIAVFSVSNIKSSEARSPLQSNNTPHICTIAEEGVGARKIVRLTPSLKPIAEVKLLTRRDLDRMRRGDIVNGGFCDPDLSWGVSNNEEVWLEGGEGGTQLERVDPYTGSIVEKVVTPRAKNICSITWFESGGFLSWWGENVSFQPFREQASYVIKKPGWVAVHTFVDGNDHFVVHWVLADFLKQNSAPSEKIVGDEGSGIAIRYSLSTWKAEAELKGWAYVDDPSLGNYVRVLFYDPRLITDEEKETSDEELAWRNKLDMFEFLGLRKVNQTPKSSIRWEIAQLNSLRAITSKSDGQQQALLWDGLFGTSAELPPERMLVNDVGNNKAIVVSKSKSGARIDLYDASHRMQVARIDVDDGLGSTGFLHKAEILIAQECVSREGERNDECNLRFYKTAQQDTALSSMSQPDATSRSAQLDTTLSISQLDTIVKVILPDAMKRAPEQIPISKNREEKVWFQKWELIIVVILVISLMAIVFVKIMTRRN